MNYQTFNNITKEDNIYLIILFSICIIYIIPNLSYNILLLFNNKIIKVLFILLIAYTATFNLSISILLFVAFFLLSYEFNKNIVHNKISNKIIASIQPSSDHNINMINDLFKDNNVSNKEKKQLFESVLKSIASDKHKFNSGTIYMNACPKKTSYIINKLYKSDMKPNNILTMSNKLIEKDDKYKHKVVMKVIKSDMNDIDKKDIIIKVLNSDIKPKYKIKIMKKMLKSDISTINKNNIINILSEQQKYDKIDGLDRKQLYENYSSI